MNYGYTNKFFQLLFFSTLVLILFSPSLSFAQETEILPVPLFIDDIYSGEISVTILPNESVQLRPSELIAYLEELMTENAIETARMIFPAEGWIDLTEMGGLGVRILFKFEDLSIHITIPAHLRRETIISLSGTRTKVIGESVLPVDISAFLNLDLWSRFTYETLDFDIAATPELGLNIFSWVLEAKGGIHTTGDLLFLDYARVVKDFPSLGFRLEVGDLTIPVTSLSSVSNLLGASFRKNYKLLQDNESTVSYSKEIFIREPSKVEIYMNDHKIREKDYQSGSYIFQDFPLSRGINRISIRWEDSEGPHNEELIIPFESNLLEVGETDLGIAVGLPDRELTLPAITSYQYLGITERFSFGLTESFHIGNLELNIRPDFLLTTDFGNFNLVPIWGMNFTGGQKVNANLGYQMLKPGMLGYLNFGANIAYSFDSMTSDDTTPSLLSVGGYYNFNFGDGFSFTPDLYWAWRFDEQRQIVRGKAILKKSIRGGSALSANIGVSYDNELEFTATISYSSSFPELNQNIYLLENLETQRLSAYWNKYTSGENDFSLNAAAEIPIRLDEKMAFGLSGGYEHPLFTVSGGHDFDAIIETSDIHNATSVRAASGLVYAEGNFILTKPVSDSFIIISPGPGFEEQILRVNPSSGGSALELNGSPGVMSTINSFTNNKIHIEPSELTPGMDDSGMRYLFQPSYKSAAVIVPQAEVLIYIGGFIKNSGGNPIDTVLGQLTGKTSKESVDFFTDENGYFEAYGLAPDTYIIKIAGFKDTPSINLSEIESGFHDAGVITIAEDE